MSRDPSPPVTSTGGSQDGGLGGCIGKYCGTTTGSTGGQGWCLGTGGTCEGQTGTQTGTGWGGKGENPPGHGGGGNPGESTPGGGGGPTVGGGLRPCTCGTGQQHPVPPRPRDCFLADTCTPGPVPVGLREPVITYKVKDVTSISDVPGARRITEILPTPQHPVLGTTVYNTPARDGSNPQADGTPSNVPTLTGPITDIADPGQQIPDPATQQPGTTVDQPTSGPDIDQQPGTKQDAPQGATADTVREALSGLDPGRSSGVKVVGSEEELNNLYGRVSNGGEPANPNYPGDFVRLPDGTTIGLRDSSKSGGPTIDIKFPDGERGKVHIDPWP